MKFFIDTANVEEIREAASLGVLDGVTTNPSLVAKTGRNFEQVLRDICDVVDGPISAEVVATDTEGIVAEGKKLAAMHPNIVVKVPLIADGINVNVVENSDNTVHITMPKAPDGATELSDEELARAAGGFWNEAPDDNKDGPLVC